MSCSPGVGFWGGLMLTCIALSTCQMSKDIKKMCGEPCVEKEKPSTHKGNQNVR